MEGNEKLYFHGGMLGEWLPMVTFVIVMVISGDDRTYFIDCFCGRCFCGNLYRISFE